MVEHNTSYEDIKNQIYERKAEMKKITNGHDEYEEYLTNGYENNGLGISDVLQVGSKVLIGGGIGLLGGVAAIAVTASAAEVIVAGVITKIAGVVGGAVGLSLGISSLKKKKKKV